MDNDNKSGFGGNLPRRDLLRAFSVAAGLGGSGLLGAEAPKAAPAKTVAGMAFKPKDTIRVAVIGVGGRGTGLLSNFLAVEGVEVTAVCDIVKEKTQRAQAMVEKGKGKAPAIYAAGERDYEKLLTRDDIDLAVIATPWNWHTPMAVFAMQHGKHAATEVPAALTMQECWALVNASERTRRHCIMLENCCYGYNEMMVLNMCRDGLFGELTHGAAAYNHDLRSVLFSKRGEGLWRRLEHTRHNGNLYSTHGLGPVAQYMNIHRGDRFVSMVSMSSPAKSLAAYRERLPQDDPSRKEKYICGDLNTSLIKTAKGLLITLEHNTSSPQPYSRINMIAGTKGLFKDYPPLIYIDGESKNHEFESIDRFKEKYEHPLWKKEGDMARKLGGHGGMDFLECFRVIECMKNGTAPDMDVYDAAAWSAPGPLSERSVAGGGVPVEFPDFTRGQWRKSRT